MSIFDFVKEKTRRFLEIEKQIVDKHGRRIRQSSNPFRSVDDDGYSDISGRSINRDLGTQKHLNQMDAVYRLFMTNPMARRMINIQVDFIIGNGIYPQIDPEKGEDDAYLHKIIYDHWEDFHNYWPVKQEFKCREMLLYGEQAYLPFINETSGLVKLGYQDPAMIKAIKMHPENPEQPGKMYLRDQACTNYDIMTEIGGRLSGEIFFMRENTVSNANRGYSELLFAIDWLQSLDDALFDILDNLAYSNLFIWDIECKGLMGDALEKRRKEMEENRPRAGGFYVHNENESIKSQSPGITSHANLEALKLIRNFILGGSGMPEHWFGAGGDVNRAVGAVMGLPTFKSLERKQNHFIYNVKLLLRYQCEQVAARIREKASMLLERSRSIPIHAPKVEEEKYDVVSEMLKTATDAMVAATEERWITEDTAARVFIDILNKYDMAIDVTQEMEALKEVRATKSEFEGKMEDSIKEYRKGVFLDDQALLDAGMKEYAKYGNTSKPGASESG